MARALDGGDHVAETTGAARVPNFARATLGGNVASHPFHRRRRAARRELMPDVASVLAEAVTDRSPSRWFLLPHAQAHVRRDEGSPGTVEIHDVTGRIRAKTVLAALKSLKRGLSQQSLDRELLNRMAFRAAMN